MKLPFNTEYPTVEDLRRLAKKRIPRFAFEYLDGGCNEDTNLERNTADIREIELDPYYLSAHTKSDMQTECFGQVYDAPFGIAPVGLQGLMWPNAAEILAKAAVQHNIPFVLSTATTSSIERIAEITGGRAWYQLYHPADQNIRDDILRRAEESGYDVLVVVVDVPIIGFRPKDIRNGLSMPPAMSFRNILQMLARPQWAFKTLLHGQPNFATLKPYMPKRLSLKQLGQFMSDTFDGRVNEEKLGPIREKWKGKLVLKGVATEADTETAIKLGVDGLVVSNHGGRQLDAGESSIHSLKRIMSYSDKIHVMMDSGIRSGPDIARTIASGAKFVFMGRPFMYGVAALGEAGGDHTIAMLKTQLHQLMEQICCERIADLPKHLIH